MKVGVSCEVLGVNHVLQMFHKLRRREPVSSLLTKTKRGLEIEAELDNPGGDVCGKIVVGGGIYPGVPLGS